MLRFRARNPELMLSLQQQRQFIASALTQLGGRLGLTALAERALSFVDESELKAQLETAVAPVKFFRTKHWDGLERFGLYRLCQYAVTDALDARSIVETGVLHGLSTVFPLSAMHVRSRHLRDERKMISIDLPSTFEAGPSNQDGYQDTLPPGLGPGWLIPAALAEQWSLRIGPSSEQLPQVVDELGVVDIFIHDSEHTYDTMMLEFRTIWPALRDGGIVIADNIDANTAFFDFAYEVNAFAHVMPVDPDHFVSGGSGIRFGVLRK